MKKAFSILILGMSVFPANAAAGTDYTAYVNPLMGTQSSHDLSAGNTYPAIARPWGMNFWTPQTGKMGDGWQYTYDAHKIRGIKQTHQPSPWINDYGQFSIMPVTGRPVFNEDERASWFSHKGETALPYYYKVYLAEHDVVAEVTPTERAAMMRFTFPKGESYIVADAFDRGSHVEIDTLNNRISGYSTRNSGGVPENFRNYFVIEFDKPITYKATFAGDSLMENTLVSDSHHSGAVIGFTTHKGEKVHARIASSFISPEQALLNLGELGDKSFDDLTAEGRDAWNDVLGRIEVESDSQDELKTFYSTLYRATLFPRQFHEINENGETVHYSPFTGEVKEGYMYTDTGVWDTFRSLFPLLNLVYPSESLKMQEGMLNINRESGFFPEWISPGHRNCMVGNNSASVLADAYLKGIRVKDTDTLWEGIVRSAHNVHPRVPSTGRLGYEYYDSIGYIPYNVGINENAARTLEYAYDDWCIYRLGKELGRPSEECDRYAGSAMNYRNLFDAESKLMRGKNADGTFQSPFSPLKWGDAFTEGNSWHYTWSVFHDPQGLIDLMGGKKEFVAMLDSVFTVPPIFDDSYYGGTIHEIREMQVMNMGNYAHGNQPIQHAIYLYNYAGEPWKAQYWVREVMDRMYSPTPDGYCGDEDNGQTSAWYVFSALGFYPVAPGSNQYVAGSPLFKKAVIHLENGNDLTISAPDNSRANRYVDKVTFNGKEHPMSYYTHDMLTSGGEMEVRMTDRPNTDRATKNNQLPYSFSTEK